MKSVSGRQRVFVLALGLALVGSSALAQTVPGLSSRPGAAYTLYLNYGGFNFTGTWGGAANGSSPGNTPAYSIDGNTGAFSQGELDNIRLSWARTAEKYVGFNINVTTIDPAIAAGQSGNDFARQAYYDSTARLMHTVIGGTGSWFNNGNSGGVSFLGTTANTYSVAGFNSGAGRGMKTNWSFMGPGFGWAWDPQFVGEVTAHENGHGLNAGHQSDFSGGTFVAEYSSGSGTGNGSYAPVMGNSYSSQRGTWRIGDTPVGNNNARATQNDVHVIAANSGLNYVDSGIGHSFATSTPLAIASGSVNPQMAKGHINPITENNPSAMGEDSYTKDVFAFRSTGGQINLRLNNGNQLLQAGTADPGATLRSRLRIFDSFGNLVANGIEDGSTLFTTYSGNLGAGDYFAQVSSFGGFQYAGNFNNGQYFDMGSYFLTGSGSLAMVPEPATMAALGIGALALMRRRRKS